MKKRKTRLFGMMLLATAMLAAAGCSKSDDNYPPTPNDNNGGYTPTPTPGGGDNGGSNNGGDNNGTSNTGTYNGHEYVDLGLPSGTLWATCNVGASSPESYGDYFAWAETSTKSSYAPSNYKYYTKTNGNYCLTKYNTDSNNGTVDYMTSLQSNDDASTAKWGNGWRTPSKSQWEELYQNTTSTWTTQSGVKGLLLTTSKGSLFLPAAGYRVFGDDIATNKHCVYWANQIDTDRTTSACQFSYHYQSGYRMASLFRGDGVPVRPVH